MQRFIETLALVFLASDFGSCLGAPVGLPLLSRLDLLPAFRDPIQVGSVSSYDRTGGNDDGFSGKYSFVRKDGEALILADLKGPGVIYRVWTPTPTDDTIEFLFDGEEQPRLQLPFRQMFLGRHPAFPKPLAGYGGGGFYSYVPLPFAKSCVVRIRAPKMQFYQINYALYSPGADISTFAFPLNTADQAERDRACAAWTRAGTDIADLSAPPGSTADRARRDIVLHPGAAETVYEDRQGGRIVGFTVSPASAVASKARDLVLRITFDGHAPAVLCPLADFFGYAWGQPATQSLLVGTVGDTNYSYFPMPYEHSARVEILSERSAPVSLHVEIAHTGVPQTAAEGKFHALWRRENPTTLGQPYTFLETTGRGHLVGVVLQAQGLESGKTLFFEGDDETTLDGQSVIHGTGSEDFFNGGWYDVPDRWEKRISFPLSGCLGYAKHLGRTGGYRFFLGDAYAYRQSLRQTIEHSGEKNSIPTDYCSVSYWYCDSDSAAPRTLPPLPQRAVVDPREVLFPAWWQLPIAAWSFEHATLSRRKEKIAGEDIRFLSLTASGQDWFGPHFLSPVCDVPAAGIYSVYLEVVQGPGQGKVQLFQNEVPVADPVDCYAEKPVKSPRLLLGRLQLNEGKNSLMLKLVGKNERAAGLELNLISIVCVREE